MTAPTNGQPGKIVPVAVVLPREATDPRFYVEAQWRTPAGLHTPKRPVKVLPLPPEIIVQLFLKLVKNGRVHAVVGMDDQNNLVLNPFPPDIQIALTPEQPPETEQPKPNLIVP